jgi:hypothetical protein
MTAEVAAVMTNNNIRSFAPESVLEGAALPHLGQK